MIILGIDPGYAIVGYGVVEKRENGTIVPIAAGTIDTPKDEDISVRLAIIDREMTQIMRRFKPDCVAVEELFFAQNTKTAIKVAEARGVILVAAIKECGRIYEYTPLQVKMALTGYGKADKKQIQYMTKTILGLKKEIRPDDAADALAVALCHAQNEKMARVCR